MESQFLDRQLSGDPVEEVAVKTVQGDARFEVKLGTADGREWSFIFDADRLQGLADLAMRSLAAPARPAGDNAA